MKKLISGGLIGLLLIIAACGDTSANEETPAPGSEWPKGVTIGAGPTGGTFHVYATAWADLIINNMNLSANVEATSGPTANIQLVEKDEVDVALVTMGPAYEGYQGIGWADQKYEKMRTILPMYQSYMHWAVAGSVQAKSIMDLDGLAIGNSVRGSTTEYYASKIFEEFGIVPSRIVYANFGDYLNQMADGQLQAVGAFSNPGHPTLGDLVKFHGAVIIGVGEESAWLAKEFGITSGVMKAGSYEGQTEDIETLTIWSAIVAHRDLPEDLVYELVKTTMEQKERLAVSVPDAIQMSVEAAVEALSTVPMHPGAIRYYEEMGAVIPESAYPPEYVK